MARPELYRHRRAQGLCGYCGKQADISGINCESCVSSITQASRKRADQRKKQGLCTMCGSKNSTPQRNVCPICAAKKQKYQAALPLEQKSGYFKKWREDQWDKIFFHYGEKCACCGETTRLFLTLDHMNNDGNIDRKQHGRKDIQVACWIIKNNFPSSFQILCMNCNWGKHRNKGICPHKQPEPVSVRQMGLL